MLKAFERLCKVKVHSIPPTEKQMLRAHRAEEHRHGLFSQYSISGLFNPKKEAVSF